MNRAGLQTLIDAAVVAAVWAGLFIAENTAMGVLWGDQFSGAWEIALARLTLIPAAVVVLAPACLAVSSGWALLKRAERGSRAAAAVFTAMGAASWAAVALGISGGRHFRNDLVRGAFVVSLGACGALFGRNLPRLTALERRPTLLAALGTLLAAAFWLADAYVLPRLYYPFHLALFIGTLLAASLVAFALRADLLPPGRVANVAAVLIAGALALFGARMGHAMGALDRATNLRIAVVEHAPLLGPMVELETRFHHPVEPPDPLAAGENDALAGPTEVARSLDWTGHDFLLLTVDALRADHVSAYGYSRPTTPNIDALAAQGTLFEDAYCPTPHTSYSVTSMMTGKYLRPLLMLGMGEDSETWAQYLRRYGWRTAGFYPPAVFFIDESRFGHFADEHLGFEYAKVEFVDPALREHQVADYLQSAASDRPLFLWVHFFEPHEPYVHHADHEFSGGASADVDAYDGEVATADEGIGRIVRVMRARRPDVVVVVTADHGEEFGEHGGHYHGTTVYEEQVRVPLVIVGPGVRPGARVKTVVQTIDALPTALSALGIPRPARIRGRDLGPLLNHGAKDGGATDGDPGFALSETDDYTLVASGADRLVCQRRAAACALYRPSQDPLERTDVSGQYPGRAADMRSLMRKTERDHGRYEASAGPAWPEALRRGIQGEIDAAPDVASLLDDADVVIRRKAAEVCFSLHAPAILPQMKRAFVHDEDLEVRRWSALAIARSGDNVAPLVESLLHDAQAPWRRAAALTLAERGSARGCDELAAWWAEVMPAGERPDGEPPQLSIDLAHAEELLSAVAKAHCRAAVPPLLLALSDVRARPYVADALGAVGDPRARGPLLSLLPKEENVLSRQREAGALRALGVSEDALRALGVSEDALRALGVSDDLIDPSQSHK